MMVSQAVLGSRFNDIPIMYSTKPKPDKTTFNSTPTGSCRKTSSGVSPQSHFLLCFRWQVSEMFTLVNTNFFQFQELDTVLYKNVPF